MDILIRDAVEKDLKEIVEIYNQAIVAKISTSDIATFNVEDKREWFEEFSKEYPILVAEYEGKVVGWISISPYRKGREGLKNTIMVSYYVHNEYKRKGVGDKLLKEMLERSKALGYKNIFGIIFDINIGSIKLLEKNGFKRWALLPDVVEIEGRIYSHLYLGRKI
ncbi:N-acetyltransferase [Candidatus Gracilibacteria bacterium]|nr:N-acetyltransferase [Candidatus Gracilibacteria bacterium]